MDEKVIVTSMVSGQIGLSYPELHIKKSWPKKGTKIPMSKDLLREVIYDPGTEYMFKNGILDIDDLAFKIELGLEPEGAKEPVNILRVDEKFMNRLLRLMPISEMESNINKMSNDQKNEFIDYACHQTDINLDRIKVIDKLCHTDLLRTIQLEQQKGE